MGTQITKMWNMRYRLLPCNVRNAQEGMRISTHSVAWWRCGCIISPFNEWRNGNCVSVGRSGQWSLVIAFVQATNESVMGHIDHGNSRDMHLHGSSLLVALMSVQSGRWSQVALVIIPSVMSSHLMLTKAVGFRASSCSLILRLAHHRKLIYPTDSRRLDLSWWPVVVLVTGADPLRGSMHFVRGVPTDNVINARYCNTCPIM